MTRSHNGKRREKYIFQMLNYFVWSIDKDKLKHADQVNKNDKEVKRN